MKNIICTLHKGPDRAEENKVVDLAAWKAEHLAEWEEPEAPRPRPRRQHRGWTAQAWAELAATLAVAIVFAALAVRVLLF